MFGPFHVIAKVDAIVNAANSQLVHGAGLAGAIAQRGGQIIQDESRAWIRAHKSLTVGKVMVTSSGQLPCRYVIHTVGPTIGGDGTKLPTNGQAQQLRKAVWNALCEAEKRELATFAIPAISSGIFGYPRDLAAREITEVDDHESFVKAIHVAAGNSVERLDEDPFKSSVRRENQSSTSRPPIPPHKASGVMVTRVGENDFEVLLGVEFRVLGGRADHSSNGDDETPKGTACREFSEEGGLLTVNHVQRAMEQSSRSMYLDFAKYTLFDVHLDTQRTRSLPEMYEKSKKRSFFSRASGAEHEHLVWIPWRELVAATSASQHSAKQQLVTSVVLLRTTFGSFSVSELVYKTVASFGSRIERQLDQLMLKDIVVSEQQRIKSLRASSDGELIDTLLESDWKLRLASPPMPPPAPIELLAPQDLDYKEVISELDANTASRVVSVRRVNVSARTGDCQQHKRQVNTIPDASCAELEPLYHGTPERWRATAIAMNGFDLSIQLCGRSRGNGVYTTSDTTVAQGYSGSSGSLLRLRGLALSTSTNSAEKTIINSESTVFVFPNPKALLPLAIIDYAAADESDTIAQQQKQIQDEYKRIAAKRRAMERSMAVKEKEFDQATGRRLRAALNVYSARLAAGQNVMKKSNQTLQNELIGARASSISQKLFLERKHFAMCLPIYEVKPQLVKLLQTTPIVILIAETGSGKSTLLPQILLDDVLPETETRRIAILQPRRVNAISLCKRVSEERGVPT